MTDAEDRSGGREMRLRFPGTCRNCGAAIAKGERARHFSASKSVACLDCSSSPASTVRAPEAPVNGLESHPGVSAQREYERRVQRRKDELTGRWGEKLGGAVAWWEDDKQSTSAWSKGARGEREVAEYLERKLAGRGCILLHDRKKPRSRSNIDHLVIGPSGITVLDAKNYKGKVRTERVGFGKNRRTILRVAGRDKTALIDGVKSQIEAVKLVVGSIEPATDVTVRGGLCWWDHEGLPLMGQLEVDGIPVLSPRASYKLAGEGGPLDVDEIRFLAGKLAEALVPA